MIKRYASIDGLAKYIGRSVKWVYRNSNSFNRAKVALNGKIVIPLQFDLDVVDSIYSAMDAGSLKTKQNQKRPNNVLSLKKRKDKSLWG